MIRACWHSLLLEICKPGGLLRLFIPPNSCTRSWADWDESQTEVLCKHLLRSIYYAFTSTPNSFAFTEAFDHLLAARKFGPHPHGSQLKAGDWEKEKNNSEKEGLRGEQTQQLSSWLQTFPSFSILHYSGSEQWLPRPGLQCSESDPPVLKAVKTAHASPIFVYLFEESHLCFVAQRSGSGLKSERLILSASIASPAGASWLSLWWCFSQWHQPEQAAFIVSCC